MHPADGQRAPTCTCMLSLSDTHVRKYTRLLLYSQMFRLFVSRRSWSPKKRVFSKASTQAGPTPFANVSARVRRPH